MNEMDLLYRLREEVPLGVSPGAEHLFHAALLSSDNPGREGVPPLPSVGPRAGRRGLRMAWRPVLAVPLALGVAAAVAVALLPSHGPGPARDSASQSARGQATAGQRGSGQSASPVQLLADRAAASALSEPDVQPSQWVYRQIEITVKGGKAQKESSEELWSTADDKAEASYYNGKLGVYYRDRNNNGVMGALDFFPVPLSYSSLGSLPANPSALVKRLAEIGVRANTGEPDGCSQGTASCTAFLAISELLSSYVMRPALTAEIYQALGDIPGVSAVPDAVIAGQPCAGFRLPLKSGYLELIVNSATDQYVATQGKFPGEANSSIAVITRQAPVSGPGVRP